jgi:SAM-dependent methyltransferase
MSDVIWQEVECGSYAADLPLWNELAADAGGPVLELGCGLGRVALHLAHQGHDITGLDANRALTAELGERISGEELPLRVEAGDAAGFELGRKFALVIAPMQLVQLLIGADARVACLGCVARHLGPGGIAAFALVDETAEGVATSPPLPDVRQRGECVYSSLPLGVSRNGDSLLVERLRQTVGPSGDLREERHTTRLRIVSPEQLESEAESAGLRAAGWRQIAPSDSHVGSTVVLLEAKV